MKRYLFIFPLLLSAAIGTFAQDNCILRIAAGETLENRENLTVCGIEIEAGGTFINEGTITFTQDFDYNTCYKSGASFINNGKIVFRNFVSNIDIYKYFNVEEFPVFTNNGIIESENFNFKLPQRLTFTTTCNSSLKATQAEFSITGGEFKLNGNVTADKMKIKRESCPQMSFGQDCPETEFDIKELEFEKFDLGTNVSINNLVGIEKLRLSNTQIRLSVSGILILGEIIKTNNWEVVQINANKNSIVSLCYNPTTHGDGLGTFLGNVYYLTEKGLTESEKAYLSYNYDFYSNGVNYKGTTYHVWTDGSTPLTEPEFNGARDIVLQLGSKMIENTESYKECLDGKFLKSSLLPIELTAFRIKQQFDIINLTWETKSETNNWKFEVEQSFDGKNFSVVGELDGFGTTSEEHFYQYSIRNTHEGILYFRIKQTDFDGGFSYSNVLTIKTKTDTNTDRKYNTLKYNMLNIKYDKDSKFIEVRQ